MSTLDQSPASVRAESRLAQPDWLLVGATVALLVIGTLMVYSASFVVAHNEFNDDLYFLSRHLGGMALGGAGLLFLARVDYHRWRGLSLVALLFCVALLLIVLVPGLGSRSYGAQRWIRLGPIQMQPSELVKIAMALYLADWLARRGRQLRHFGNGTIPFAVIVVMVAALVELQPDLGTTVVIVGSAACVFFLAGANLAHIALLGAAGVCGVLAMIVRMAGYRQDRITAFLDPWADLQGTGWHTAQTLISLGSGGPLGLGLGNSRHKFYWVPNAHTDAIFAIIGEELGFVGAMFVLMLFGVIAWRGFMIALRAPDAFGRLFAAGLTATITLQALINIAVVTNSVPYTGVPLPFVSYGSSSTVTCMLAIGLLLSISRHRNAPREEAEVPSNEAPQPRPSDGRVRSNARRPALMPDAALRSRSSAGPYGHGGRPWTTSRFDTGGGQARPTRRRALRGQSGGQRGRGSFGRND